MRRRLARATVGAAAARATVLRHRCRPVPAGPPAPDPALSDGARRCTEGWRIAAAGRPRAAQPAASTARCAAARRGKLMRRSDMLESSRVATWVGCTVSLEVLLFLDESRRQYRRVEPVPKSAPPWPPGAAVLATLMRTARARRLAYRRKRRQMLAPPLPPPPGPPQAAVAAVTASDSRCCCPCRALAATRTRLAAVPALLAASPPFPPCTAVARDELAAVERHGRVDAGERDAGAAASAGRTALSHRIRRRRRSRRVAPVKPSQGRCTVAGAFAPPPPPPPWPAPPGLPAVPSAGVNLSRLRVQKGAHAATRAGVAGGAVVAGLSAASPRGPRCSSSWHWFNRLLSYPRRYLSRRPVCSPSTPVQGQRVDSPVTAMAARPRDTRARGAGTCSDCRWATPDCSDWPSRHSRPCCPVCSPSRADAPKATPSAALRACPRPQA